MSIFSEATYMQNRDECCKASIHLQWHCIEVRKQFECGLLGYLLFLDGEMNNVK